MASARGILNIQSLNELTSRMAVWGWRMRLRMRARLYGLCARATQRLGVLLSIFLR